MENQEQKKRRRPKRSRVGENIRMLRRKRGWSLADVAMFTQIPEPTLQQYEEGISMVPADRLKILSTLFGVSIDYLVTGEDSASNFARQHPDHFRLLNRAAKELPADRFERLKDFMRYYLDHRGEVPGLNWDEIIDAHQRSLEEEYGRED